MYRESDSAIMAVKSTEDRPRSGLWAAGTQAVPTTWPLLGVMRTLSRQRPRAEGIFRGPLTVSLTVPT